LALRRVFFRRTFPIHGQEWAELCMDGAADSCEHPRRRRIGELEGGRSAVFYLAVPRGQIAPVRGATHETVRFRRRLPYRVAVLEDAFLGGKRRPETLQAFENVHASLSLKTFMHP
jgi:hypothetical protein